MNTITPSQKVNCVLKLQLFWKSDIFLFKVVYRVLQLQFWICMMVKLENYKDPSIWESDWSLPAPWRIANSEQVTSRRQKFKSAMFMFFFAPKKLVLLICCIAKHCCNARQSTDGTEGQGRDTRPDKSLPHYLNCQFSCTLFSRVPNRDCTATKPTISLNRE